ncbi:hypothetical protein TOK_5391 [Pseudonocardia sp. N23]|nr:hypothetical protein TOK_5391 [Pseudonocardia sp. N23]
MASVEPVGERTRERTEDERGQQLRRDDTAQREALRLVAGGQLRRERGQREQREPVTRRRDRRDQPEPAERGDRQDAADTMRRRGRQRRVTGRSGLGTDRSSPPRRARPGWRDLNRHRGANAGHPVTRE